MELTFTAIEGNSKRYKILIVTLGALTMAGLIAYILSYLKGFQVWGISNLTIWGQLITVDIYFIGLSAGSLVVSSLTYVLGREQYRPIGRLAVFMGLLLMAGAMLCVLADLGRPEKFWRLFMYFYLSNMTSMFAINGIFYAGYIALLLVYLGGALTNNRALTRIVAPVAVLWAVLVHMGTGAIFGFVATREIFYSSLKPVEFISAAFASGLALVILLTVITSKFANRHIDNKMVVSLGRLLSILIAILVVLIITDKLTHFYPPEREGVLFLATGSFSWMFWLLQIMFGYVVPLAILVHPRWGKTVQGIATAAAFNVVGIFGERAALVIPGLAHAMPYYPGHIEGLWGARGGFPIMPVETILVVGIFAFLGLLYVLGLKYLELLPAKEDGEQAPAPVESPTPASE